MYKKEYDGISLQFVLSLFVYFLFSFRKKKKKTVTVISLIRTSNFIRVLIFPEHLHAPPVVSAAEYVSESSESKEMIEVLCIIFVKR